MALSESEEFELLSLERARAMSASPKRAVAPQSPAIPSVQAEPSFLESASKFIGVGGGRSLPESGARQLGLTARAAGPVAAGAAAGAALGAPLAGVGAIPGAGAGAAAMAILQMVDSLGGTQYIEQAMDKLGLPKPEGATERVGTGVARTMASVGGLTGAAGALAPKAGEASKPWLDILAKYPGMQTTAAAAGGTAGEVARESGAGPIGQTAATLAGGIAAPAGGAAIKSFGKGVVDAGATIGAAFGSKAGVRRLEIDVANRYAGDPVSREKIIFALENAKEVVPGVKPMVQDVLAQRNIGQPEQVGGAIIRLQKDLSGAKSIEDVLPSAVRRQNKGVQQYLDDLEAASKGPREDALKAANAGGVKTKKVLDTVDELAARPGMAADDVATKSLAEIKAKLLSHTNENGIIEANNLYTIRKKLGVTIGKFSKESADWDKRLTSGLIRDIQRSIDDVIVDAGGTGWKQYLAKYSAGMKNAEQIELIRAEAKRIASGVKGISAATLGKEDLPKIPTLLHRPMMFVNFALRMVGQDANEPLVKSLAKTMQDPAEFAKLMRRPPTDPIRQRADEILRKAAIVATIRAQSEEETPSP